MLFILINLASHAQITRGTLSEEIYVGIDWYFNGNQFVYALLHSIDNGEHFNINYSSDVFPVSQTLFIITSDATPGVIYGTNQNNLYISSNYGADWNFIESTGLDGRYASGCIEGEIYKYHHPNSQTRFYRSTNYGQDFELVNEQVYGFPEVGTEDGEVYILIGYPPEYPLLLLRSFDYGSNFDTVVINNDIGGYVLLGNNPKISRGANPGEIYLVTWHLPSNYYIYYSNDYGETFELRFQSEEYLMHNWGFRFTAGNQPGSFFVKRTSSSESVDHALFYIDYSSDSAKTFTTYSHEMDSTYSVGEIITQQNLLAYPNPSKGSVTFEIFYASIASESYIYIYSILGNIVRVIPINGEKIYWDGKNENGLAGKPGIYFYQINSSEFSSNIYKILLVGH